jgi:hypothetical protein
MLEWSYGVTTVPQRLTTLLPRTLSSLAAAGFTSPRLFVDGGCSERPSGLLVTQRDVAVRAFGNWALAAWELYVARPQARRYAIFQDDIVLCRGARQYLEACEFPEKGYLNLFTFATNEAMIFGRPKGWHKSDQLGKGAVALVFDHEAMTSLLKQPHMVDKPQLPTGHKNVDGAIQHSLVKQAGFVEYVHNPSLVQHVGREGTLGNSQHPDAKTFPGEQFDAMSLLGETRG